MKFSNFKESDSYIFPGTIQIEDFSKKTRIRIDISDILNSIQEIELNLYRERIMRK